jgi:TonB family protein
MELSRSEENKNRAISAGVTALLFGLLLLFFILYQLITPNPPFPEGGGGGGQELALGMMTVGNDDIDYGSMGSVTDVVEAKESTPQEKIVTVEEGEEVQITESKPEIKNNTTVITPVKPKEVVKEKTAAEKLAEKFKKKTGKDGGGVGDNDKPGDAGDPGGDPFKSGTGGTGTGTQGGDGEGDGPGSGPGRNGIGGGSKFGISLRGRTVVTPPRLPSDTKEEGKVVVDITVDSEGNVIEAIPSGRGTNTSSPALKAKARQAALATKFNVDGKYEEQTGTITIIFSFSE